MTVQIEPARPTTLPRIAQLTNKTNQFNLTTRRYTESDLLALQAEGFEIFGIHVADRFGDSGLVGVAILGPVVDAAREIDSLLLSCRVMGRQVETALLDHLAELTRSGGATTLRGAFIPTAKNVPARDCYQRHGFELVDELSDGGSVWGLDVSDYSPRAPDWLTVRVAEAVAR
jgi:FkbH-like protein